MNKSEWNRILNGYAQPSASRSSLQLINTAIPYLLLYGIGGWVLHSGLHIFLILAIILPVIVLSALFMVRLFILFHDCTHQSFYHSRTANDFWGHILGILTFTPYKTWQRSHNLHHGSVGDLDRRGIGDVWTLTVTEYEALDRMMRLWYRVYRHPAMLFFISPLFLFAVMNRFPSNKKSKDEWVSSTITNLGILAGFLLTSLVFSWQTYFQLQLPILYLAAIMGVWLFFVQHQFDDVYWAKHEQWDIVRAALEGSTYFKLPVIFEWFTGNIGYHHIHHLNSRIPNYNLKRCYLEIEGLQDPVTVDLVGSFRLAFLHLYDETSGRMIGFKEFRRRRVQNA